MITRGPAVERTYRWIVLLAMLSTFVLIVLGAVVRVSGSGLGCTEWPSCENGTVVPPARVDALIEMSHRVSASIVSVFVALTALGALVLYRRRPLVLTLALTIAGLLVVQILLGAVTVRLELPEDVVTLHLGTAEAILGLLVLLNLAFIQPRGAVDLPVGAVRRHDRTFWLALATAAAIFAVVLSGAYVRGHGAASACGADWPLCQGRLFPWSELTAVHLGHRYLVGLVSLLVAWVVVAAWRQRSRLPALGHAAATLALIFVVQILVGAANPWTQLSPVAQAAHLAVATLLWGLAVALAALSWWLVPAADEVPARSGDASRVPTGARVLSDTSGS